MKPKTFTTPLLLTLLAAFLLAGCNRDTNPNTTNTNGTTTVTPTPTPATSTTP